MVHISLPVAEQYHMPIVFIGSYALSYLLLKAIRSAGRRNRKAPPTVSWTLPLVGSVPFLPAFDVWHIYFMKKSREIGDVFSLYLCGRYSIVLNGRKALHEALIKRSSDFADRPEFYTSKAILNPNANGIFDHHYGPKFRRQQQLALTILKEFGFGKEIMEQRIHVEASSLVQMLRSFEGRPIWPDLAITSHVLNVIVSILFGKRMEKSPLDDLVSVIHGFIHDTVQSFPVDLFPPLRFLPHLQRELHTMRELNRRFFVIIDNGIDNCEAESFVQRYVDLEGDRLDKEQLRFLIRDLLLAGTESSASTLLWALGELAQPNGRRIQEQMHSEISSVVSRSQLPSLSDRSKLPYVDATILELMRVRTIVPFALTHATYCDTNVEGFFIPAGTMVIPNLYSVHMDPEEWDNPEQFRPERFLDESGQIVGKERVIPFSLGRRSCLGEILAVQEIYLFITAIVQNFTILPPEGCDSFELHEKVSITIVPDKYEVCLVPRP